jgi:hypothetical protein
LRIGTRNSAGTVPPLWVKRLVKVFSASMPGPKSVTSVTTFFIPFFAAHSAMPTVTCGK